MDNITGYVDHIVYQNSDNGYTVMALVAEGEEVTCVGMCKGLGQGENISAEGEYIEHPVYGRQFKIQTYETVAPTDRAGMERYLGSGAIRGVGEALAARIVKKFGDDTFRIIEEEPERLAEVKGISERKAQEIAVQMEEKKDLREALVYLQQYGISNTLAVKIYNTYGMEMYSVMRENPYRLAEDVSGVGFRIADEIAGRIGIHTDSDYRIRSGILYTLLQAVGEGHCFLPLELLLRRASELLGVSEENIRPQVDNLIMDRKLVAKGDALFAAAYYYAELNCANMLRNLNIPMLEAENLPAQDMAIRKRLERMAENLSMELDELQLKAVEESIKNGLFILSGGPGTGKTTTINMIIRYFESEGMDIFLAAPTGRAAKRMTEATGFEAKTIHRLLELNSALSDDDTRRANFERNQENPLEADVVIIDEMSMVDIQLFQALLKAILPGTRLILVGDVDQLPSVGAGNVLADVMNSGEIECVTLDRIYRQAGESLIVTNAHAVNRGEMPELNDKTRDFFYLSVSEPERIAAKTADMVERAAGFIGVTPDRVHVLCPRKNGAAGSININKLLQNRLNPSKGGATIEDEDYVYREGDKVMHVVNNYDLEWKIASGYNYREGTGVYNGDIGVIREINRSRGDMTVEFEDGRVAVYTPDIYNQLVLAYAITVHKSQGSEFDAVVMPVTSGGPMIMTRNLLYTAITRAKKMVVLIGERYNIKKMVDNNYVAKRYSLLTGFLKQAKRDSRLLFGSGEDEN